MSRNLEPSLFVCIPMNTVLISFTSNKYNQGAHMKILTKTVSLFALFFALTCFAPPQVQAQWSIGASYEIRQESPEKGFGGRIGYALLGNQSMLDLRLRGHLSYFSEEYQNYRDFDVPAELTNYDFGLMAVGGVSLGMLTPYVGLGLGANTFKLQGDDLPDNSPFDETESNSKISWTGLAGAEVSVLPFLHPFVEYRFEPADRPGFADFGDSDSGRIVLGLSLSF